MPREGGANTQGQARMRGFQYTVKVVLIDLNELPVDQGRERLFRDSRQVCQHSGHKWQFVSLEAITDFVIVGCLLYTSDAADE